jgi:hypothetical protein
MYGHYTRPGIHEAASKMNSIVLHRKRCAMAQRNAAINVTKA